MIRDILAEYFDRYPLAGPQDAVKLIYQHVFGPGHLIRDREKTLRVLREEMALLSAWDGKEPLYERIGGGLCRLNLRPCIAKGIPAEDICALLTEAAEGTKGDVKKFRQALGELEEMADYGETPFEGIALDVFLMDYRDRGCPPVHHSVPYREAYRPAYRVVIQKKLKDYLAARREEAGGGNESLQKS